MHRSRFTALVTAVVVLSGCGGGSAASGLPGPLAAAAGLIEALMKAVPGLSKQQAIVGAGSMLSLAKANLPADKFAQLSKALPGTEALISEATRAGLPARPTKLTSLVSVFSQSGISLDQALKMIPVLTKAASNGGGAAQGQALAGALR